MLEGMGVDVKMETRRWMKTGMVGRNRDEHNDGKREDRLSHLRMRSDH